MATKSYSKHKEYKEFSSSRSNAPYTDEQFDMLKSELIPKGSKLDSLGRNGVEAREYHYEYKEEKHPTGKYDRKDLHTVEEYTIPPKSLPKSAESNAYYYEREEMDLPAITTGSRTYNYETTNSTPGYSKVKSSKVTRDLSHNVGELDSLLDDLQKDQERQLYKSGYTSDTAESTSFDYKRGTPAKAPSSGYSTLKREERVESSSWGSSPPPTVTRTADLRQEMYREEKTESRVIPSQVSPAVPLAVPPTICAHCHQPPLTGTLSRSGTPMNKVTTTVKTYTYEVPADQDPAAVPIPVVADHHHTYVSTSDHRSTSSHSGVPASPQLNAGGPTGPCVGGAGGAGCQYCSHCNSRLRDVTYIREHLTTEDEHTKERMVYPTPANETRLVPQDPPGHTPHGPTTYKYSETSYSAHNTTSRYPSSPAPTTNLRPHPSPSPLPPSSTPTPGFPRPTTPSPSTQQPPKKLDDLLADFPEARFPTQPDGVSRRRVEVSQQSQSQVQSQGAGSAAHRAPNVAGPAVYYPPGHTPFAPKPAGYQSAAMQQGGGAYASGRGMYEYEAGAKSKEKHTEKKTAVPICLPLCCAMPCVIL